MTDTDRRTETALTPEVRCSFGWAQEVVRYLVEPLSLDGYMVALYGSVLTAGVGRDMDFLLVPWRRGANPEGAIGTILSFTGGQEVGRRYRGAMGTLATTIAVDGRVLDVQIREVPHDPALLPPR